MIHDTLEQAKAAVEQYEAGMRALHEATGVYEECDDSCCNIYVTAKYRNESGEILTYTSI